MKQASRIFSILLIFYAVAQPQAMGCLCTDAVCAQGPASCAEQCGFQDEHEGCCDCGSEYDCLTSVIWLTSHHRLGDSYSAIRLPMRQPLISPFYCQSAIATRSLHLPGGKRLFLLRCNSSCYSTKTNSLLI